MIINVKNLEFQPCDYIGKPPKMISYEIVKIQPNPFYKKESEYRKDGEWFYKDNDIAIHKSVFENPKSKYTILTFEYDDKDHDYNVGFISNRYMDLNQEEWIALGELLSRANDYLTLNNKN